MTPFSVSWHTLLEELDELPEGATLITPLSHDRLHIADVQEQRVVIEFLDRDIDETRPLQRDQFETLYRRITEESGEFKLDRLPPDADPYPAVLSLHPRFEIDEDRGVIIEKEGSTTSQLHDTADTYAAEEQDRTEPDLDVYADALLLVDTLERHEVDVLEEMETDALVNLYTLLSGVQRNANDLRQDVADVLLQRLHHDRPVGGPFGSVQRTTRRNRTLKDDEKVLETLEEAGIDRDRVLGVDRDKVDDALEVTELSESDVYEIEETTPGDQNDVYTLLAAWNESIAATLERSGGDRFRAVMKQYRPEIIELVDGAATNGEIDWPFLRECIEAYPPGVGDHYCSSILANVVARCIIRTRITQSVDEIPP